jgi:GT2 family glycosyltransferase
MSDADLELTTHPGHRLGAIIFDPRGGSLIAITGDLPHRFSTDDPRRYRPLISAGVTTLSPLSRRQPTVSVVIPARNPPADSFDDLVGNLASSPWVQEVIVVDDGSDQPITVEGATVIRNEIALGPAGARNLGAEQSTNEVLVFVDADIASIDEHLFELISMFGSNQIAALAPRVIESGHPSPLDLGPDPTEVDGKHLNHLPGAVLAIDRSSFEMVAGFAEDLRLGEDVDLIARICALGRWAIYAPSCIAVHHSQSLATRLAKAASYGYSVGHLRRRTRLTLTPRLRDTPAFGWIVIAPFTMAAITALKRTSQLKHRLTPDQRTKAAILLLDTQVIANASLIVRQFGLPMALLALGSRRIRRGLITALLLQLVHQGVTRTIYDLAYSIGLWLSLALET